MKTLIFILTLFGSLSAASMTSTDYRRTLGLVDVYSQEVHACATDNNCTYICVTKLVASEFRYLSVIENFDSTGTYLDKLRDANVINHGFQVCEASSLTEGVYHENKRTLERVPKR